jgi:hypothetical protein
MPRSHLVPMLLLVSGLLTLFACGGGTEPSKPQITGVIVSNGSAFTVSNVFVRPCNAGQFSNSLTVTTDLEAGATDTILLPVGCYGMVAVTSDNAQTLRVNDSIQVAANVPVNLTLTAQKFAQAGALEAVKGCLLLDDAALPNILGMYGRFFILDHFFDDDADAALALVGVTQNVFWGIPTSIYPMDDEYGGDNAFADKAGYIAFGENLYHHHLAMHGTTAIWGTLAHEFGHRVQQTQPWGTDQRYVVTIGGLTNYSVARELEADAFSGYYAVLGEQAPQDEIDQLYQHFYSLGSNAWQDPQWHGTAWQRESASYVGIYVADYERSHSVHYNYAQLHEGFIASILSDVLQHPDPPSAAMSASMKAAVSQLPHQRLRDVALGKRHWN